MRHNRTTEAVRMYEKAASIDQDNPDTHYNVSTLFLDEALFCCCQPRGTSPL